MAKNREETEKTILNAVTELVGQSGFGSLGVNAVAEKAGVSKVLIYRYFGSYRGLLEHWALARNFWFKTSAETERELAEAAGNRVSLAAALKRLVRSQAEELRADKVSREVLRWFLAEKDAAAATVMARLEERGAALTAAFSGGLNGAPDMGSIAAIVVAGIYYLVLLADRAEVFNGVDIASDPGWQGILGALDRLIDVLILGESMKAPEES